MNREVRYDGRNMLQIRFPFDRNLVERIKSLPNRRWNASERYWTVPEHDVVLLVELLSGDRFSFDEATQALYAGLGGTAELDPAEATTPTTPRDATDLTVSDLNEQVKRVIEGAFPQPVWLVGEISGFNRNAHKRHVSFKLAEFGDDGRNVSSVDATLFEQSRRSLEQQLALAGNPFSLEDEVMVRVLARVELYVPWGSYRVIVEELDVHYTLGEAARRREEIIRRLGEQGLVGINSALELPALPLRLGLVTSLGSDAYNDVLRTLEESGFAFQVTAHGARVQGHSTEPSVLNALERLGGIAGELDAVIVCRGGGSRTDLAWFDSEALGRAVARFPIPVIVGIGHEQDHSVLDAVGRRCKTPTAAAAFLVDRVQEGIDHIESVGSTLLALAGRRIAEETNRSAERCRRLALAARGLLDRERIEVEHRRGRAQRAAVGALTVGRERLTRWIRDLPRATSVHFARQSIFLDNARRAVSQGAGRDIAAARNALQQTARSILPRAVQCLRQEEERTVSRGRRLDLVDPGRVLERGYAILRAADGPLVTRVADAPRGAALTAELRDGVLNVRSEGTNSEQGGD